MPKTKNPVTYKEIQQEISEHHLCATYPDDFDDWDTEDQRNFINANIWEPLEHTLEADAVMEHIAAISDTVAVLIQKALKQGYKP